MLKSGEGLNVLIRTRRHLPMGISVLSAVIAAYSAFLSRQQVERTTRPWLAIDAVEVQTQDGQISQTTFSLKNYGQGPALHIRYSAGATASWDMQHILYGKPVSRDFDPDADRWMEDKYTTEMPSIAPGQSSIITEAEPKLTDSVMQYKGQTVQNAEWRATASLTYQDLSGHIHHTHRCYLIESLSQGKTKTRACPNGSEMD